MTTDWPNYVKKPGTRDWQRSAIEWLRQLLPARYATYPTLSRFPVLLARQAQIQVQQEEQMTRIALRTARAELPRMGVPESVIEHMITMHLLELSQLQKTARSVQAVSSALASRQLGSCIVDSHAQRR
ncbi:hypothetical protein [Streptomyces collinus]|uniref:hypothetical protein n=1 Tax=Streptomyces collinus TaxID=42684 RepID=UPI0036F0E676